MCQIFSLREREGAREREREREGARAAFSFHDYVSNQMTDRFYIITCTRGGSVCSLYGVAVSDCLFFICRA